MAIAVTTHSDGRSTTITVTGGVTTTLWQIFSENQTLSSKATATNPYPIEISSAETKPGNVIVVTVDELSVWFPPNQVFQVRYKHDDDEWTALESFTSTGYFNSYDRFLDF